MKNLSIRYIRDFERFDAPEPFYLVTLNNQQFHLHLSELDAIQNWSDSEGPDEIRFIRYP